MSTNDVYLVDYLRIPFSRSRPKEPEKDVFNPIRMDEQLGRLLNKIVRNNVIKPEEIDDVITGCALQQGENWTYGGRQPIFLADLPVSVTGMAVDRACSSSLNALAIGSMEIMTGNADIILAGGMEHLTHVPLNENTYVAPDPKILKDPEFAKYDMKTGFNMGLTAENLAELNGISRDEMDVYSYESHLRATNALKNGFFQNEIMPVQINSKGKSTIISEDQSIRKDASLETMKSLKPAFKDGGKVTAGNSAPLNAGASAVMLMSERKVKEYGIKPLSKIVSFGWAGVHPSIMGEGPVPASLKALKKAGLTSDDIGLWEINEAFAVVVINAMKKLNIDRDKVNVHGGGIAIGHPLGATGTRLAGTLSRIMNERQSEYGVATLCVGGGQGYSVVFQRY